MALKKALWSIIIYPDSGDINKACEVITASGGQYLYILHNKDKYEHDSKDGSYKKSDTKKSHYHFVCGWSSKAPTWDIFCNMMPTFGGVCPSKKRHPYDPEVAEVKDPESLELYLTHSDPASASNPYKFKYSDSDLIYSQGWNIMEYFTYVKKRALNSTKLSQKKQEISEDLQKIFDICIKNEIYEFYELYVYLMRNSSDLLSVLLSSPYPVKVFLDSFRNSNATLQKQIERSVELAKQTENRINEFRDMAIFWKHKFCECYEYFTDIRIECSDTVDLDINIVYPPRRVGNICE